MPSRNVDLATIEEWRELDFFYDSSESDRTWVLRGDRRSLRAFAGKIRVYANNPKSKVEGEHEHFGPYFYLKIQTGLAPAIDQTGWTGTVSDLARLAQIIEGHLAQSGRGDFVVSQDFAPETLWSIRFVVEDDGFDPSSVDALIRHRS